MLTLAFYGSSLLSSYWNGAATYYRGLLQALAGHGWRIIFYEPDAYNRQQHRDIAPPDWARVVVYDNDPQACAAVIAAAREADVVVKASGVGAFDDELLAVFDHAREDAARIFWDVDAPATLSTLRAEPLHPLRQALEKLDHVLTYGGGQPVIDAYRALGARACTPIYNALDPATHYPVAAEPRLSADLSLLANRLPDRERRIEAFFLVPAQCAPQRSFLLGGSGWEDKSTSANVRRVGHVPTAAHNAFNASARAVLNVARDSMADIGFSPATRVFEAAGAGACIITDAWQGVELFLKPDLEILVARDGKDVLAHLESLSAARALGIGTAARRRVLEGHTYAHRAVQADAVLRNALSQRAARNAA